MDRNPEQTSVLARRFVLGLLAVGGTFGYAWSFTLNPAACGMFSQAAVVGIAAGVSWVCFGLLLLAVTRCRPSLLAWVDVCLTTMAVGIGFLAISVISNWAALGPVRIVGWGSFTPGFIHAAVLLLSNLAMGFTFVWQARLLGMRIVTASALWIGGLDGVFLVMVRLLYPVGGLL